MQPSVRARVVASSGAAVVAALVILLATRHGVGINTDSVWYHEMAAGVRQTAHFPPGYPWMLRVLSDRAIAVGSFALLIGFAAYAFGWLAALLLLTTPAIVLVNSWAWSEPPFLVALLVFVWAVADTRFAAASLCTVAMILLRHVGIAAIPVLAFEVWRAKGWRGWVYLLPPVCALLSLRSARVYAWHPPSVADWRELAITAKRTFVPLSGVAGWAMLAMLAVANVFKRVTLRIRADAFTRVALLCAASYTCTVILARTVADGGIPFDQRIFAPVVMVALVMLSRSVTVAGLTGRVAATVWIATRALVTLAFVASVTRTGQGYGSVEWRESAMVAYVRALPADTPLYATDAAGLRYAAGRAATDIPYISDPGTRAPVDRDSIVTAFVARAHAEHAAVIFPHRVVPALPFFMPEAAFARACGCAPDTTFPEAAVFDFAR